ncbi:MAG: hypothetical protein MI863_24695 [Desulfobacterales bacterium]|nr:hypothetical protein [Desulfobacterales bacterium]
MPSYTVEKPCRPDGVTYMTEGDVKLTQRQAKYLLISGHLKPKQEKKTGTKKAAGK